MGKDRKAGCDDPAEGRVYSAGHPTSYRDGPQPPAARRMLLAGNVNVGKSVIFRRLCPRNARQNDSARAASGPACGEVRGQDIELLDVPGTCSIFAQHEDDAASRDVILSGRADSILFVADGKNLRRSLTLALQCAEYGLPMVIDINMMDDAIQRGIAIDADGLSSILGVPVSSTVASEGQGIPALRRALPRAAVPERLVRYPQEVQEALDSLASALADTGLPVRATALLLLAGDEHTKRFVARRVAPEKLRLIESMANDAQRHSQRPLGVVLTEQYTRAAERIADQVRSVEAPVSAPFAGRLGVWCREVPTGVPIFMLVVATMYLFVGRFGAQYLVGIFEGRLFGDKIIPWTAKACSVIPWEFVRRAIVGDPQAPRGDFGLVSIGLTLALGIVMPVLFTFFLFSGFLEESGYLPRLSVLLDRVFRKIGMNGKAVLPIIMGFSCITMAILTTRMLDTRAQRNIATLLLILGIPCAPLLGVMLVLLADMAWYAYVTIFGIIALQIILVGYVASKLSRARRSPLILELPEMRIPRLRSIIARAIWRTGLFLREAVPMFLLATFALFLLSEAGALDVLERAGQPVLERFVGVPAETINVFLMSAVRREAGVALLKGFADRGMLDDVQTVVALLVMTFLTPCVNALLVIVKERGLKVAVAIGAFVMPYALIVGALVNAVCRAFNVHFR